MIRSYLLSLVIGLTISTSFGQPSYDNCNNPVVINDVTNYCSKVAEYTNIMATPSGYGSATCWSATNTDVWFRFRAFFTDVNITIIGTNARGGGTPGGTMARPMVALYRGICGAPFPN